MAARETRPVKLGVNVVPDGTVKVMIPAVDTVVVVKATRKSVLAPAALDGLELLKLTLVTELAKADHPDKFTYDPLHPVPSYGGNVCCSGNAIPGNGGDRGRL